MLNNDCCQTEKSNEDLTRCYSVKQLLTMQDELNDAVKPGWKGLLAPENFIVAFIDEMGGEFLGSGVDWKHWKFTDPDNFDLHNAKIEIVDAAFFWMSVINIHASNKVDQRFMFCNDNASVYEQFDYFYAGADKPLNGDGGVIAGKNVLKHDNYVHIFRRVLSSNGSDIFEDIYTLGMIASCLGMVCSEFSAYYAAKYELNMFRNDSGYKTGEYQKVTDGLEDNERLKPEIEAFMADTSMTLDDLRQNVFDAFYEPVTS